MGKWAKGLTRKRTEKNLVCLRSLFHEIFVWANGEQDEKNARVRLRSFV
jgi:hypothetical protein